jgi:ABC-type multidrug transport system ATPase subunit
MEPERSHHTSSGEEDDDSTLEDFLAERESRRLTNPFEWMGHPRMGLVLSWKGVGYQVQMNKSRMPCLQKGHPYDRVILRDISGSAWRGELIVVIGDGTAGKSCFMDVLAGRSVVGVPSGLVEESGRRRDPDWYRKSSLILPQTSFHQWLTVRETIRIAALLKLPAAMSSSLVEANVDKVLRITDLVAWKDVWARNLPDHGVSGGESMRLALAVELITDPEVLLVDFDLLGMAPDAARRMVRELGKMARVDGRIVFLSISLRSLPILDLVDKVLVLSRGQTLFYGPVHRAYRHFLRQGCGEPHDPKMTCFLMGVASFDLTRRDLRQSCQERIERLAKAWRGSKMQVSRPARPKTLAILGPPGSMLQQMQEGGSCTSFSGAKDDVHWPRSPWGEFSVLFGRESLVRFRNRPKLLLSTTQLILSALLVGFLFFQLPKSATGIFPRIVLFVVLPKLQYIYIILPLLEALFLFRPVIVRERASLSYHAASQYTSSFLSSMPVRLAQWTLFSLIMYWIVGLRTDGFQYFVAFTGLLLANALASIGFAFLCTGLTRGQVGDALIFFPTLIVISFQFNGGLPQCSWVLRWIQYVFPNYFAVTGMVQNEFSGNPSIPGADELLRITHYDNPSLAWCYGALLIQTAVYGLAGYLLEERNTRPRFILF